MTDHRLFEALARADRWLIERIFEPAAWRIERWLDVAPAMIARVLLVVWTAGAVAHCWQTPGLVAFIVAALIVLVTPLRMWTLESIERNVGRHGTANPEKHRPVDTFFRIFLCGCNITDAVLSAILGYVTPLQVGSGCYLLHLYFAACDRPPPMVEADAELAPMGAAP